MQERVVLSIVYVNPMYVVVQGMIDRYQIHPYG